MDRDQNRNRNGIDRDRDYDRGSATQGSWDRDRDDRYGWADFGQRYQSGFDRFSAGSDQRYQPTSNQITPYRREDQMMYGNRDAQLYGHREHPSLMDRVRAFFGKGPKGYRRADERITEDVNERLSEGYLDATLIEVSTKDGEVTLIGTVIDRRSKRIAEDLAEAVRGVRDVHNRLTVRPESETESPTSSTRKAGEKTTFTPKA